MRYVRGLIHEFKPDEGFGLIVAGTTGNLCTEYAGDSDKYSRIFKVQLQYKKIKTTKSDTHTRVRASAHARTQTHIWVTLTSVTCLTGTETKSTTAAVHQYTLCNPPQRTQRQ